MTHALLSAFALLGALAFGPSGARGADLDDFACVQKMEVPTYLSPIWQARIEAKAVAKFTLDSHGVVAKFMVESPSQAMAVWLKGRLADATFLPECKDRVVQLDFTYRLQGQPRESPESRVYIKRPGSFEIVGVPPVLHPSVD